MTDLKQTPLYHLHMANQARMVPFAGYEMPLHYPGGILHEHRHTRQKAGLFDISHMGQLRLVAKNHHDVAQCFERLVPGGITSLRDGAMRYTVLTNEQGGIYDDLMVTRLDDSLWLVVNAARVEEDIAHIANTLADDIDLQPQQRALLALQGPQAASILDDSDIDFMTARRHQWRGQDILVSRCGYTGEDGYEISLPPECAEDFARNLLNHPDVELIGLGARDGLRLEAGLCLYGHDIDETTSPIEANLLWTIPKRRRQSDDYPGASHIIAQMDNGVKRMRVGILPDELGTIAREGTQICALDATPIGHVTSGGFSPILQRPCAMGYVRADMAHTGNQIGLMRRGELKTAHIVDLPFVPHRYYTAS